MTRTSYEPALRRFRVGDVAYLRVRVAAAARAPGEHGEIVGGPAAAVEVIGRDGRATSETRHYVNEADLVSPIEAMRAVRGETR